MPERRLVIASNRVPAAAGVRAGVGGLVAALQPALEGRGGLWFGWSGAVEEMTDLVRRNEGAVEFATFGLTRAEVDGYYEGFSNRTLWPLMHGLAERAEVRAGEYERWRAVNARFASLLAPLLLPDDLVWVHDYHLIALGTELRARGWRGRLGYFHHIPIPVERDWRRIPRVEEIAAAFAEYDVIGVQTQRDAARLRSCLGSDAAVRVGAFPIGIDPARTRTLAAAHPNDPFEERDGRQVLLGVDRLDYSKGIPDRLIAFERLLHRAPAIADEAVLVQWSAPSRESIEDYRAERQTVEDLVARLAARGGRISATMRNEVLPAEMVAAALRDADVCLVTSRADGMNLVAKEFVAAQRPEAPGVLILSDGCGAAEELTEALIVPSGDIDALAGAMARALRMPLEERSERWGRLSAKVEDGNVREWCRTYIEALA